MPKLEPKQIQQELEKGLIWPFYWIYGPESLKSKELIKRIKKAIFGTDTVDESTASFSIQSFDGAEADVYSILDMAQSPSLLGGIRLLVIRDAHQLKNSELLVDLLGPARQLSQLDGVCIAVAKDFDARKKFSKVLVERAAVVACDEITEAQREAWILYLAKRRGLELQPSQVMHLNAIDPWSLDIVDQELEKFTLTGSQSDVFLQSLDRMGGVDDFIESFFQRNKKLSLEHLGYFADQPDQTLPLLGLLTWNVRQLVRFISDQSGHQNSSKMSFYLMERIKRWASLWGLHELISLQKDLFRLDYRTKQTPLLPLGSWSQVVIRYTR
jgi:DNA polymerase-3 subunit delta